jgi:hypothetical protein
MEEIWVNFCKQEDVEVGAFNLVKSLGSYVPPCTYLLVGSGSPAIVRKLLRGFF